MKVRGLVAGIAVVIVASTLVFAVQAPQATLQVDVSMQAPGVFDPLLNAYVLKSPGSFTWTGNVQVSAALVPGLENPAPSADDLSRLVVRWQWLGQGVNENQTTAAGVLTDTAVQVESRPGNSAKEQRLRVTLSGEVRINGQWYTVGPNQRFDATPVPYIVK